MPRVIHAFEDCELDLRLYQLRRRGRPVKLEPKVFDVLAHLIAHRDRVVTKLELLDALWPGETVSDSVLPRAIAAARRAVGDDRGSARVLATVHGRGYRFVAALRAGTGEAEAHSPVEDAPAFASPFVGRESILAKLEAALAFASAGRACIALLAGEPGIGKTRTTEEIAARARANGALTAFGRCHEGEGAPAFWPWRQLLRALAERCDRAPLEAAMGADAGELALLAPELGVASGVAIEGEQARFRLFDALAGFVRRLAQERTLVLVLDDLHWADEASLRAFGFLASELREGRVLMIGTYRDVEVRREHPLRELLGALARLPSCERLALRGLERPALNALVSAVAGRPASEELGRAVLEMTEGNPFFAVELARLLRDSPDASLSTLALPQNVRDAIGRRLDALSPAAVQALRAAAVLGRSFDAGLLSRLTETAPDALLDAIDEAQSAGVLSEGAERVGSFSFTHALVRQTLLEELRAPERVRLHRRAAEALESTLAAGDDGALSEIAHHYFEALPGGTAAPAAAAAERAARNAHQLLAYEESARLYEQALEALASAAQPDSLRRYELLAAAGGEHAAAGNRDSARGHFRAAANAARALGRADLLTRAAIGFRGLGEMGVPPDAETLGLLEEARAALGESHPIQRARLLSRLTGTPPYSLSMATRDALSREALAIARASGDDATLHDALGARVWACYGPDHVAERIELGHELAALGRRTADPLAEFAGHETLFAAHMLLGNAAEVDRALAACSRVARDLRYAYVEFQARYFEAARIACAGRLAEADAALEAALAIGRDRFPYAQLQCDAHRLWVAIQRGD
ncbi:MAG TPA: AAA family ATPase, partial [Myxococcota bacterium]|nr:AAA family ATPase [Myxococcota bacterium]